MIPISCTRFWTYVFRLAISVHSYWCSYYFRGAPGGVTLWRCSCWFWARVACLEQLQCGRRVSSRSLRLHSLEVSQKRKHSLSLALLKLFWFISKLCFTSCHCYNNIDNNNDNNNDNARFILRIYLAWYFDSFLSFS